MLKKLSILAIALFLFGGSTFAFAWWDDLETTDSDVDIEIGEGATLEVDFDEVTDKSLVPNSAIQTEDTTTEAAVEYEIGFEEDIETSSIDLTLTFGAFKIDDKDNVGDSDVLVEDIIDIDESVEFSDLDVSDGSTETVDFTVALDDESIQDNLDDDDLNEEDIETIQEGSLTFDVTFVAEIPES